MPHRRVPTLVCCDNITFCISNDANVFSFGYSEDGSHGHEEKLVYPPKMIPSLTNITSVVTGEFHSACLDYDGNIYTFGDNECGQLGIGKDTSYQTCIPQKVNLPPCKQVSCGNRFTICLTKCGLLYSLGNNHSGVLDFGNGATFSSTPHLISSLKDVEFVECGELHVFCKTIHNEIYSWGDNEYGQLGLGHIDNQKTPLLCSSLLNEDITDIKCNNLNTLALTSNGDVLSCGNNDDGQLGRETNDASYSALFKKIETLSGIIRIECGYDHSLCIDVNNNLFVFGLNVFGQLGLADNENRHKPIKHEKLSNIIDISKGGWHTFVKTSNNEIYGFGENISSLLGIKKQERFKTIRVLQDNEDIWCSNINKSKAKSARK